jgi:hypothetical protein
MIRGVRLIGRIFTRGVLVVLVLVSMSLRVLSLTVSGVQVALSGALSAAGVSTVAAREAAAAQSRRAAARKLTRDTAQRVSNRVARGAARNSASVFGEAIPVVGVAVIAGALAYEVKDACDTARDMAGLEAMVANPQDPDLAFSNATEAFACSDLIPEISALPDRDAIWDEMVSAPGSAWQSAEEYYADLPDRSLISGYDWMLAWLGGVYNSVFGGAE